MPKDEPKDPTPPPAKPGAKRSGRVRFDERGQAVWEWAVQTGKFDRNASTQQVRTLTDSTVKLEIDKDADGKTGSAGSKKSGGFNPYQRSDSTRKR